MRRKDLEAVRTVMKLSVKGRRERGRSRMKWLNGIKCDMMTAGMCVNDVGD